MAAPFVFFSLGYHLLARQAAATRKSFERNDVKRADPAILEKAELEELAFLDRGLRGIMAAAVFNLINAGYLETESHTEEGKTGVYRTLKAAPVARKDLALAAKESTLSPLEVGIVGFLQGRAMMYTELCDTLPSEVVASLDTLGKQCGEKFFREGYILSEGQASALRDRLKPARKHLFLFSILGAPAPSLIVSLLFMERFGDFFPLVVLHHILSALIFFVYSEARPLDAMEQRGEFFLSGAGREALDAFMEREQSMAKKLSQSIPSLIRELLEVPGYPNDPNDFRIC